MMTERIASFVAENPAFKMDATGEYQIVGFIREKFKKFPDGHWECDSKKWNTTDDLLLHMIALHDLMNEWMIYVRMDYEEKLLSLTKRIEALESPIR